MSKNDQECAGLLQQGLAAWHGWKLFKTDNHVGGCGGDDSDWRKAADGTDEAKGTLELGLHCCRTMMTTLIHAVVHSCAPRVTSL
eukprot:4532169-Amphidinium_carterae.1